VTCRLTDELIGYDELAEQCKSICADRQSFDVAIRELCRQKRCVVATGVHGEKVIFSLFRFTDVDFLGSRKSCVKIRLYIELLQIGVVI